MAGQQERTEPQSRADSLSFVTVATGFRHGHGSWLPETLHQVQDGPPLSVHCRCVFTGTLVVVPDVAALARSGERQESVRASGERGSGGQGGDAERGRGGSAPEGMRGLRALGVRDLNYRMAFLASAVQVGLPSP